MQENHPGGTGRQRLNMDFGNSNTVVVIRDQQGMIRFHDYSYGSHPFPTTGQEDPVPRIPSQILYSDTGTRYIGVAEPPEGTVPSGIARRLRHYILENSAVQISAGIGRRIGYRIAGADFLTTLLIHASRASTGTSDVVFSVPVDAPEHYSSWLRAVATAAGFSVPFVIDEACAAALGYGLLLSPESMFLLIDFHPDGIDIAVVTPGEFLQDRRGFFSRLHGKAHEEIGGSMIDSWIVLDILVRNKWHETDPRAVVLLPLIRNEVARAREALGMNTEAEIQVTDKRTGFSLKVILTREDISRILEERGLFATINRAIDRAMSSAGIRGDEEERIIAVLMLGECSSIPCVQEALKYRWGADRVHCDHPVDAIARGAAAANPETIEPNRIRNDYAIRHWDPVAREYRYRFIVRNGARYPSAGQVGRFIISGAYDGQAYLGVPLCEISIANHDPHGHIELISNDKGELQMAGPAPEAIPAMSPVVVNIQEPTLLHAEPPALKGQPRFELTFSLDRHGFLCLTARDLLTGLIVKRDAQVFRLN